MPNPLLPFFNRPIIAACVVGNAGLFIGSWALLWCDAEVGDVFQTTLLIALGVWWRCLLFGTILAYGLFRFSLPLRRLLLSLLVAGSLISLGLTTVSWKAAWQSPGNWPDPMVYSLGGFWLGESDADPQDVRFPGSDRVAKMRGKRAVIWVHFCSMLPWSVWIMGLAIRGNQGRTEDLYRMEHRGWWWRALQSRWISACLILGLWILAMLMSEIAASDIFYVRTYAEEIYLGFPLGDRFSLNPLRQNAPTRLPWHLHFLAITSTGLALGQALGVFSSKWLHTPWVPDRRMSLGKWRWPISLAFLGFLLFCTMIPLWDLTREVGTTVLITQQNVEPVWQWSHAFHQWLDIPFRLRHEILWSLMISIGATGITFVISQFSAWKSICSKRFRWLVFLLVGFLWSMPAPLIGVFCLRSVDFLNWEWLHRLANQSLALPVVSLCLYLLPLSFALTFVLCRRTPSLLIDQSHLEYSSGLLRWYQTAFRPQILWHIALIWFLFVISFNDIAATNLVLPAGTDTIARRLLGLVHAGVDDQVAAASLWNYAISAMLAATFFYIFSDKGET